MLQHLREEWIGQVMRGAIAMSSMWTRIAPSRRCRADQQVPFGL